MFGPCFLKTVVLIALTALTAQAFAQGTPEVVLPDPDLSSPIYKQPRNVEHGWNVRVNPLHPTEKIYTKDSATYRVPFNLTDSEKMLAGALAGATILAFATEREMLDFVQKNDGKVGDRLAKFSEPFGSSKVTYGLLAGMTYAVVAQSGEATRFYALAIKSGVITKVVNDALKNTFRRALPNETSDPFKVSGKKSTTDYGMPSGHASTAFSLATVVAETYGRQNTYIPILAYGTATLTAWQRIYDNQHWVSDVIVGAFVGHIIGKNVVRGGQTRGGFDVTPYFDHRSIGAQVTYTNEGPYSSKPQACIRAEERPRGLEECMDAHLNNRY